jgi:hypothetical protein
MSDNSASKRNNYFNRKKHKNKSRNDTDNGSHSSSATNYQRLLSNSSKTDSKN